MQYVAHQFIIILLRVASSSSLESSRILCLDLVEGFRNLLVWFISAILCGDKSWTLLRGRTYLEVEIEASHLDPLRI